MKSLKALVVSKSKSTVRVVDRAGQYFDCSVKREVYQSHQVLVPGDTVTVKPEQGLSWIVAARERTNLLKRYLRRERELRFIAANVDELYLLISGAQPKFDIANLIMLLAGANECGIHPIVVVTKSDLLKRADLEKISLVIKKFEVDFYLSGFGNKESVKALKLRSKNKLIALIGKSGVGKSTLTNMFFPTLKLKTSNVIKKGFSGKHTTTQSRLFIPEEDYYLIDTPGFNIFDLGYENRKHLTKNLFSPEHCKMNDCLHITEDHCGIRGDLLSSSAGVQIYESYKKILDSYHFIQPF